MIWQLTTVHTRYDTRVGIRECGDLFEKFKSEFQLVVADGDGDRDFSEQNYRIVDLGRLPESRALRFIFGSIKSVRLILKKKPKVVHFHDPELMIVGLICRVFKIKVIYDVHESVHMQIHRKKWIPAFLRPSISKVIATFERLCANRMTSVVCATPIIAQQFPLANTVLVQNYPLLNELVLNNSIKYESRPNQAVYVGGITTVRAAREMVASVQNTEPSLDFVLEMLGDCRSPELQEELEKLDVNNRVVFRGWSNRETVSDVLSKSRVGLVLCYPILQYPKSQPTKMYEYMSAGLPVIASDFPLWKSIIDESECGLVVDPENSNSIATALQFIINNPVKAKNMGMNGRAAVEKKYNWSVESARLMEMYEEITSDIFGDTKQ